MMVRWFFRNKGLGYIGNKKKKKEKGEEWQNIGVVSPLLDSTSNEMKGKAR